MINKDDFIKNNIIETTLCKSVSKEKRKALMKTMNQLILVKN